ILPPKIAPLQVVIVPIYKGEDSKSKIDEKADMLLKELKAKGISVKYDNSDTARPGWKFAEYEMKGVPVRVALGLRDIDNNVAEVARRDTRDKQSVSLDGLGDHIVQLLDDIQQNIFNRALSFRNSNIRKADTWEEFESILDQQGGFIAAHWDGSSETEALIKEKTRATIRCIPMEAEQEAGRCILTGKPSTQRVLFARAY